MPPMQKRIREMLPKIARAKMTNAKRTRIGIFSNARIDSKIATFATKILRQTGSLGTENFD